MSELTKINKAKQQLEKAKTFSEIKEIMDISKAAQAYFKAANAGLVASNEAKEVELLARRKAGEFLLGMEKNKGAEGNPHGQGVRFQDGTTQTYAELEISKSTAHRCQTEAIVPEDVFQERVNKKKEKGKELTTSEFYSLGKRIKKQAKRESIDKYEPGLHDIDEAKVISGDARKMDLSDFEKYGVILADPPWKYNAVTGRGIAEDNYSVLTLEDLIDMPVKKITKDDSVLFLWTTWPMIEDAFKVMDAWGFTYKTGFPWVKTSRKNGKVFYGVGRWIRGATEPILMGVRGNAKPSKEMGNYIGLLSPRLAHSRKPDDLHTMAEKLPGPRIELFARRSKPGWTVFGNEVRRSLL